MIAFDDAALEHIAERVAVRVAERLKAEQTQAHRSDGAYESLKAIAEALGVSDSYLRRLARLGCLPGALRAGRAWRARRADVEGALRAGFERPLHPGVVDLHERARKLLGHPGRVGGAR